MIGFLLLAASIALMVAGACDAVVGWQLGRRAKEAGVAGWHGESATLHGQSAARWLRSAFAFVVASVCSGVATWLL